MIINNIVSIVCAAGRPDDRGQVEEDRAGDWNALGSGGP